MFRFFGTIHARKFGLGLIALSLCACTSPDIYNNPDFNPPVRWGAHRVEPGDTLYAIAWRYGRDVNELARSNGLKAPYTLHPGQRIDLAAKAPSYSPPPVSRSKVASVPKADPSAKQKRSGGVVYKNKQSATQAVTSSSSTQVLKWQWPHTGAIIDSYSATGRINKGIDIAGKIGEPVVAASSGEVVYAGNGLIGYGPLVILNHNEDFLSAYAHNSRILVKEGDFVRRGEQITELGSEGTNRPKLHFEIRHNGKPVDPLRFLPER